MGSTNWFRLRLIRLTCVLLLLSASNVFGQENDKFLKAGFDDDSTFLFFYSKYQKAIKENDSLYLATINDYPLKVSYWLKKPFIIKDQKSFLNRYSQIYSKSLRELILSQTPDDLHTTWRGAFVGRGEVWFVGYIIDDSSRILIPSFNLSTDASNK